MHKITLVYGDCAKQVKQVVLEKVASSQGLLLLWPEIKDGLPLCPTDIMERIVGCLYPRVNIVIGTVHQIPILTAQSMIYNKLVPASLFEFFGVIDGSPRWIAHSANGDFIDMWPNQTQQEIDFNLRFHNPVEDLQCFPEFRERFGHE